MVHIQWKDRYNIGYKEIDTQHRALLDVLNDLIDLTSGRRDPEALAAIFHRLVTYVHTHFATEERYMVACGYPRVEDHKAQHASFVQRLLELNATFEASDPRLAPEILEFVKTWYLDHIIKSDLDYVPFLQRYGKEAPVKAVLFDFGNVVCRFDNDRFLQSLAALCDKTPEALNEGLYQQSGLTQDYEAGRIGSAEFLDGISTLCGRPLSEDAFLTAYTGIFTPIQATLDLIPKLKQSCQVGLISNTSPWHFEHAIKTLDVFPYFDSVTLSYEVRASKPDPALFQDALDKLGLMAEECVYIDDQRPFAQAATEYLMHGLAYTTPEALLAELRRLKVQV